MTPGNELIVQQYFRAWSSHDGGALSALFDENGTYEGPATPMAVHAFDLSAIVEALVAQFSDFSFEIVRLGAAHDLVYAEWMLRGTSDGPVKKGVDATGRKLHLSGVDVQITKGKITRARRFYDRHAMFQQIGLQVLVEPILQGRRRFGYSLHASSDNQSQPGIIALTWIQGRDEAEKDRIREHSNQIIEDFLKEPGFIGIVTGFAGERGFTCTAWQDEKSLDRALDRHHARAKQDFRAGGLSPGVWTSVWKPHHINRLWVRCLSCDQPNDVTDNHHECKKCGADLPPTPTYW